MALTAAEQYLLELINRARLDPMGEARLYGIDLNSGLSAGTISGAAKQVLAPNALLESAAIKHSQWMIATDIISHTGANGSTPYQRAVAEGYKPGWVGENISWRGTTGAMNLDSYIETQHRDLFLSSGHRTNIMSTSYREIGIAQETGVVRQGGVDYNSSMITEVFGSSGTARFITGVSYFDSDNNRFYSIGEGYGGVTINAAGNSAVTAAAGGYGLAVEAANATSATDVTGQVGRASFFIKLDMSSGNVKLDAVNGYLFQTSGSITLMYGLNDATLLGVANLKAVGNDYNNILTGNSGNNILDGRAEQDTLYGGGGADTVVGGRGTDVLYGGDGNDVIQGGPGSDGVWGGTGADRFIFMNGAGFDAIQDFSLGEDRIRLDDANWRGVLTASQAVDAFARVTTGGVLFDFGDGDQLLILHLRSPQALAAYIDII